MAAKAGLNIVQTWPKPYKAIMKKKLTADFIIVQTSSAIPDLPSISVAYSVELGGGGACLHVTTVFY